ASTARRASSRVAGTARASTRARTWPSGAALAVCSSCLASNNACSSSSACKGVSARKRCGFMAAPLGGRAASITPADQNYQKLFTHPNGRDGPTRSPLPLLRGSGEPTMTENLEQKGSGAKDADQQERPADGPAVAFGEPVRHEEADAGSQRCLC